MNERIKELFLQAGFHPPVVKQMGDEYKFEKFAELIVQECSGFVYNYPQKYLTRDQAREISLKMEEHFGIEEYYEETCPRCDAPDGGTSCGLPYCGLITGF